MSTQNLQTEYNRRSDTLSALVVSAVFFLVLSQAFILHVPEIVTQVFRPIIIIVMLLRMSRDGIVVASNYRTAALLAALYCFFAMLLHKFNINELTRTSAVVLYLLMFWSVSGVRWNRKEIQLIMFSCLLAAFVCAIAIFVSNDPTDLHVGTSGEMEMLGVSINRNKNAYAFSIGTIIGLAYILYGNTRFKPLILCVTAVSAYALLYSQCRGAFFCAVAGIVILVFGLLFRIRRKNPNGFIVYSVLFILSCVIVYYLLKNSELSRLVDGDSTSGRDEGIKHAWELFLQSDLLGKVFGHGFGFEGENSEEIGAHLVYVSYLLSIGIIGTILITLMFVQTFRNIRSPIPLALWSAAFLRTLFEGLDYYIYIPLILAVILNHYQRSNRRSVHELFR